MAKSKTGTVKYSMYSVKYKLTLSLRNANVSSLSMKYGNRPWKLMPNVSTHISRKALYEYARDYAIAERLLKPRY